MASKNPKSQKLKHRSNPMKKTKKKSSKPKFLSSSNPNRIPLGKNKVIFEKKKPTDHQTTTTTITPTPKEKQQKQKKEIAEVDRGTTLLSTAPAAQQLEFFLHRYQSANGLKLSPLELEAFKDTSMIELSQDMDQNVSNFSTHMKAAFGSSWREVLCDGNSQGIIDAGSPALLVISTSALRSLELLRGLKPFTTECRPVKLFAKHMKVEDQVTLLKTRVNIASGTPSRIKKLIDLDALLLSRLAVVVLDMHQDAKGYSLLTLPQVSDEFWDLYMSHFHQRLLQGDTRICFYGPVPNLEIKKAIQSEEQ